jgi:hypothetical protein
MSQWMTFITARMNFRKFDLGDCKSDDQTIEPIEGLAIKRHTESPQSCRTFPLQATDSSDTECALKQTQRLGFFTSDHNYQAEGIEFVMPSFFDFEILPKHLIVRLICFRSLRFPRFLG